MIYSPEVNKSSIFDMPQTNALIFYMGEVSELLRKIMVNSSHVFNLSNCSVVFEV